VDQERERRRFVRFPAELAVLVQKLGPQGEENLGKTEVVGLGGCLFIHPQSLGLEETIELLISAKGSVVRAKGRVAYEKQRADGRYDVGVEFLAMSEEDQAKLEALLASLPPPAGD
jgi:hypothetical protein